MVLFILESLNFVSFVLIDAGPFAPEFSDLDFTLLEMNPFTLVNNVPCPLDMRGELDDTALFKNFQKYAVVPEIF